MCGMQRDDWPVTYIGVESVPDFMLQGYSLRAAYGRLLQGWGIGNSADLYTIRINDSHMIGSVIRRILFEDSLGHPNL
jgi:hypothetical protein